MNENNRGITIISLVVTIIVLLIITGISLYESNIGIGESKDNVYVTELGTVQHSVTERYTKYKLTKNTELLVGTRVDTSSLEDVPNTIVWKITEFDSVNFPEKEYYRLNKTNLESLGLTSNSTTNSSYIVNYFTGEVYNETLKTTKSGEVLYSSIK